MEFRRMLTAMVVAFAVYVAYQFLYARLFPPPPPPPERWEDVPAAFRSESSTEPTTQAVAESAQPAPAVLTRGPNNEAIHIGGQEGYFLGAALRPLGASLESLDITQRHPNGKLVHWVTEKKGEEPRPYPLLRPVRAGDEEAYSYSTHQVWVRSGSAPASSWRLDDLNWTVESASASEVVFVTELQPANLTESAPPTGAPATSAPATGEPAPRLRIRKRYALEPGKRLLHLELSAENLGSTPVDVIFEQDGPIGLRSEDAQHESRRLLVARRDEGEATIAQNLLRTDLQKRIENGRLPELTPIGQTDLLWTALSNRFFAVFTRPVPEQGWVADKLDNVRGVLAAPNMDSTVADMTPRFVTKPLRVEPGGTSRVRFEIYGGPKDSDVLRESGPQYVDVTQLGYSLSQSTDISCVCTFQPLPQLMTWLLRTIHWFIPNYGLAIIVLVIIVRTLLHPLAVFQQKSMYRMMEAQVRIGPKMQAIREKHANDRVKQQQEIMKMMAEEGVNPAAGLVSMIPMFIQMPLLVALWTALQTEIQLRNAPFDGWWITDLSSPDALIRFSGPGLTIPVLSWLPLIGWIFTNIPSFNLLPILMGVSMFLQQKYMPKPHMQARMAAAKQSAAERKPGQGLTPEEQMRQQQVVMTMMNVLFPIMFYYMPSGLNLYWMATNVFGIVESIIVRRHIERDKLKREREGPRPPDPRKPGPVARWMKRIAEQAEELQRQADAVSNRNPGSKKR